MNPDLLELLACPLCVSQDIPANLILQNPVYEGSRIQEGRLQCDKCGIGYAIRGGIPRFTDTATPGVQHQIATNFGDAWQLYAEESEAHSAEQPTSDHHIHPYDQDQFLDWIHPLTPEDFAGKQVLDLGSGLGAFAGFAARYNAKRVVGLEISHAVDASAYLLKTHPNLDFIQGNILKPPLKREAFDLVYSIGVLHHLEKPREGFKSAVSLVKLNGQLFIWVYGRENNGLVVYIVDPLRKLLCKLPVNFVRKVIAYPLAMVMYALIQTLYTSKHMRWLPYYDYFQWLRPYGFPYMRGMITDQLIPPRTHYHSEPELKTWFRAAKLDIQSMTPRNAISWRVLGEKTG